MCRSLSTSTTVCISTLQAVRDLLRAVPDLIRAIMEENMADADYKPVQLIDFQCLQRVHDRARAGEERR